MNTKSIQILAVLLLLITACATPTLPTGGPKDQTPPQLVSATTENFSTNFDASNIILTFNEWIKLSNPGQEIHTSPPLGKIADYRAIKNKLFITFKEDLEPDLTYHINFGNAIQDVNENNPLQNFQYIFSTGDKIDSLEFRGSLEKINDAEITDNTIIGLYPVEKGDSAFYKEIPFYYTYADKNGSFAFRNLKNGKYLVRVLSDANSNKFYDLPNEQVGFLEDTLDLDSNIFNLKLALFKEEAPERKIKSFTNTISDYKSEYTFNQPLSANENFKLQFLTDSIELVSFTTINSTRDVVTTIFDKQLDSVPNFKTVIFIDSMILDTLEQSTSNLKVPELEFSLKHEKYLQNDTLIINSNLPIASIEKNIEIIDTLNGDTTPINTYLNTDNQLFVKLDSTFAINHVYTLLIPDSAIFDIYDRVNSKYEENFSIESEEERGMLFLTFTDIDSSLQYLVDLLNEKNEIVARTIISSENTKWNFTKLRTGIYKMKIVEDENLNGIWNSGSVFEKKFPEEIYTHPTEITIRPNWELEEEISLVKTKN